MDCFSQIFKTESLAAPGFHERLVGIIVDCFQKKHPEISIENKSIEILTNLMHSFCLACGQAPFNFAEFIDQHLKNKREIKTFIAKLLYGLYFRDFDLVELSKKHPRQHIRFFLLQILSETANAGTLRKAIRSLSWDDLAVFIAVAHLNYREGSFLLLRQIQDLFRKNPMINLLLRNLSRKYISPSAFFNYLAKTVVKDLRDLEKISQNLQEGAAKQIQTIYQLFYPLILSLIASPVKTYQALENLKGLQKTQDPQKLLEAQNLSKKFKEAFDFFLEKKNSEESFAVFFQQFGLYGHQPPIKVPGFHDSESLLQKIQALHKLFQNPLSFASMPQEDLQAIYAFVLRICYRLYTYHCASDRYKEGLDLLTFAMPTFGKDLSRQPWLFSIASGLNTLSEYFKKANLEISLDQYPIYVFDQSPKRLFVKNQRFIRKLEERFKCCIVHVSQTEALLLAKKLHLEKLIATQEKGAFGYGGARNCVYFLTPMLKAAHKLGKRTVSEAIDLNEDELQTLFRRSVLGEVAQGQDAVLHMGDDDIEVPEACIFADLLFAQKFNQEYFDRMTYIIGRATNIINPYLDLQSFLKSPAGLYHFTQWKDTANLAGIVGLLSKPKFCLNLPFGSEEKDFRLKGYSDPFRPALIHLSGNRHPSKQIPADPFSGLAESLEKINVYVFHIGMVQSLLDSRDNKGRCVFPWNPRRNESPYPFTSLGQALKFASQEKYKKEMQKRFWKNVDGLLSPEQKTTFLIGMDLEYLLNQDVDASIREFRQTNPLFEKVKSLDEIGLCYKRFQKDAKLFQDFLEKVKNEICQRVENPSTWFEGCVELNLSAIIEQIRKEMEVQNRVRFKQWPFTHGLYLLLRSVGAGEFSDLLNLQT